uniref:Uncharacterized protein n=1 Tax=Octopus bimaculoides TaxID=37653 RepID=A0A0L8GI43_OCTBM
MSNFPLSQCHGEAKMWFSQLEFYFIATSTRQPLVKLHITFSGLPSPLVSSVRDLLTDIPDGMSYEKSEVLRRNSPSADTRYKHNYCYILLTYNMLEIYCFH